MEATAVPVRDALVNLVVRAIVTCRSNPDRRFTAGRTTAFADAAASLAHSVYGVDLSEATLYLRKRVAGVREQGIKDHAQIGQEADVIVTSMLEKV